MDTADLMKMAAVWLRRLSSATTRNFVIAHSLHTASRTKMSSPETEVEKAGCPREGKPAAGQDGSTAKVSIKKQWGSFFGDLK